MRKSGDRGWLFIAIAAVVVLHYISACAPTTEVERIDAEYRRQDRANRCADFQRICPAIVIRVGDRLHCGAALMHCPGRLSR